MAQTVDSSQLITFGGTGGSAQQFQFPNTSDGSYYMSWRGGTVIDSITIASTAESSQTTRYGGGGGDYSSGLYLTPLTIINIREVWYAPYNDQAVVSKFIFSITNTEGQEQEIIFGSIEARLLTKTVIKPADLYVQFYGGSFDSYVDQLTFVLPS